jgi:hypothetical protein
MRFGLYFYFTIQSFRFDIALYCHNKNQLLFSKERESSGALRRGQGPSLESSVRDLRKVSCPHGGHRS